MRRHWEVKSSKVKGKRLEKTKESQQAVSRILSPLRADDHSSRLAITGEIQRPTRRLRTGRPTQLERRIERRAGRLPIWSCSVRGFACHRPYGRRGALLPHLFTLTREGGRCIFCATVLQVTLTGRYPAHCPTEFGLSSSACAPAV